MESTWKDHKSGPKGISTPHSGSPAERVFVIIGSSKPFFGIMSNAWAYTRSQTGPGKASLIVSGCALRMTAFRDSIGRMMFIGGSAVGVWGISIRRNEHILHKSHNVNPWRLTASKLKCSPPLFLPSKGRAPLHSINLHSPNSRLGTCCSGAASLMGLVQITTDDSALKFKLRILGIGLAYLVRHFFPTDSHRLLALS